MKPVSLLLFLALPLAAAQPQVLIYGGTPSGIAAAVAAGREGIQVILLEPTPRLGGMLTSGLSHADYHSRESLTGFYLEFSLRVEKYYIEKYGPDSEQVKTSWKGTFAEPHVNLKILEELLAEQKTVEVIKNARVNALTLDGPEITSATYSTPQGPATTTAKVFIDATYEGDLLPLAKITYRVGREGKAEFNESLAPDEPDEQLQAYNFRFCATDIPENRAPVLKPAGYQREDFLPLLKIIADKKLDEVFGYPPVRCIYKRQTPALPNGKYDINDVSHSIVRLSMPGANLGWPEGDEKTRAAIFSEHVRHNTGLLYFLQNDEKVPAEWQKKANEWGWCLDEFQETNHLPPQLYVREARRMQGEHIYTQPDSAAAPNDARAKLFTDSIAMGDYGNNCHGTAHQGPLIGGKHTGEFYNPVPPYQIPYGVLLPKKAECVNLLAPGPVSSSHVGFCALRLEPIWCSLGQAAGHAAALSIKSGKPLHEIDLPTLQSALHQDGSATIYLSDILPGDPDFAAAQWWGTLGGFHGLEPSGKPRGQKIYGQYSQAPPGHAAKLDEVPDPKTRAAWLALGETMNLAPRSLPETITGREFIRAMFQNKQKKLSAP